MKFDVNLNYIVEAETEADANEIIGQLRYVPSFANGTAKLRGFNMYEHAEPALPSVGS